MRITLNFEAKETTSPDFSVISVTSGNVVTSGGFVQATTNQNQFSQVLVSPSGTVIASAEGNVLTSVNDPYTPGYWNAILTINGDILTIDDEVVWVDI